MSPVNNAIRVTFDRQVACEPEFGSALRTHFQEGIAPFGPKVVLELKFVDRLPNWCAEMVRAFGLVRGGAPKYARGVELLGEHRVSNRGVGLKTAAQVPDGRREAAAGVLGTAVPVGA
jgi:hypothetical protein